MSEKVDNLEKKEKIFGGILASFLLALLGGVFWIALYWYDIFAPVSGIVIGVLAVIGYRLVTKKENAKSIVLALVASLIAICICCYISLSIDVYFAYNDLYEAGEWAQPVSFGQAFLHSYQFFSDPGIVMTFIRETGLGMACALLGVFAFIVDAIKNRNKQKKNSAE